MPNSVAGSPIDAGLIEEIRRQLAKRWLAVKLWAKAAEQHRKAPDVNDRVLESFATAYAKSPLVTGRWARLFRRRWRTSKVRLITCKNHDGLACILVKDSSWRRVRRQTRSGFAHKHLLRLAQTALVRKDDGRPYALLVYGGPESGQNTPVAYFCREPIEEGQRILDAVVQAASGGEMPQLLKFDSVRWLPGGVGYATLVQMKRSPRTLMKFLGLQLTGGKHPDWMNIGACVATISLVVSMPLWILGVPYGDDMLSFALIAFLLMAMVGSDEAADALLESFGSADE